MSRKGANRAIKLLDDIGFEEITDIPMKLLVSGLGATLIEERLSNSDGKILRGKRKTLIKVNSDIQYEPRKRFTIAHELGHHLLHDNLEIHEENSNTLNWFDTETKLKKGVQEAEANDFAAELLMPEQIFRREIEGEFFSPDLVKNLSLRFKTSLTSIVFRMIQLNTHSIFVSFISNGKVRYWKKSDGLKVWVKDINKLSPPSDSVALEYIEGNYEFIYIGEDKMQEIVRSTWFEMNDREEDDLFYEYCIPTKQYKTIISIVWEG